MRIKSQTLKLASLRCSINDDFLAVKLRSFGDRIESKGFTLDRLLHTIACIAGNQLVHRVIYN